MVVRRNCDLPACAVEHTVGRLGCSIGSQRRRAQHVVEHRTDAHVDAGAPRPLSPGRPAGAGRRAGAGLGAGEMGGGGARASAVANPCTSAPTPVATPPANPFGPNVTIFDPS